MPLSDRIDGRISLFSRNVGGLGAALEAGRNDKRQNQLFDFATQRESDRVEDRDRQQGFEDDAIAQAKQQAAQQAQRMAEFESIVRGVNELEPLLDNLPKLIKRAGARSRSITSTGGNDADTQQIIQLAQSGNVDAIRQEFARVRQMSQQLQAQGLGIRPTGQERTPAAIQEFNMLSDAAQERGLDGKPTERARQAQIQLGTQARAGTTSSRERIATDSDLTSDVAESEAEIAGATAFAKKEGVSRGNAIDSGFEAIAKIDKNIRNIDRAIDAIDGGASTGVIESRFFPSFREATIRLEQVQKELGLDVIGSVTFGALSKGELDLALETALPVGLQPTELREFLVSKKAAQDKLRQYYSDQVDFLDQDGTIPGFLRQQNRKRDEENRGGESPAVDSGEQSFDDGTTVVFD